MACSARTAQTRRCSSTWGGVNKTSRQELRSQFFRVRVWDADNLLDAVLRNYDKLSEELRADLPLKRVWSLVEE